MFEADLSINFIAFMIIRTKLISFSPVDYLSIGSTEDNSQLFCLLHNGYLGVLVH